MRFMGGKHVVGRRIAEFCSGVRLPGQIYLEPFVGAASVIRHMKDPRLAFDLNESLILLWQELQNGWVPPGDVSEEMHSAMKVDGPPSALKAFVRFGCGWGGGWKGGYARSSNETNFAAQARASLLRKLSTLAGVSFVHGDYRDLRPNGMLIYCDPPYENSPDIYGIGKFNHNEFWDVVREWSVGNTVVISSWMAPSDFGCVLEIDSGVSKGCTVRLEGGVSGKGNEKLFMFGSGGES